MTKPHTPLTREVVNKLREQTELMIAYPKDRAINYLAMEWLHKEDTIKILNDVIKDRDRQIAELHLIQTPTHKETKRLARRLQR